MRSVASILSGGLIAAFGSPALAHDAPIRAALSWDRRPGAETCIDDVGMRTAVESRLERAVFVPKASAELLLSGVAQPAPDAKGWLFRITATDRAGTVLGEREIEAASGSCNEWVDAVSIVMALAVDSSRRRIRIHLPASAPASPREPWVWGADLGPEASVMAGIVPGLGFAAGLRATIQPPGFVPFELSWAGLLPRRQREAAAGADYVGWQAGAFVCPRLLSAEAVGLSACAGGLFGLLRATGVNLDTPRTATSRIGWLAGRISLTVGDWRLRPRMAVSGLVPLVRDRFVYDDVSGAHELYRPWPVGVQADLGLSLRIP